MISLKKNTGTATCAVVLTFEVFGAVLIVETLDKLLKLLFLSLLFLQGSALYSFSVEEQMKKLSFREKRHMNAFFNKAIETDQASHVLYFETKPVALVAIVLQSRGKVIKEEIKPLKGWKAFKKHQKLFPHPNFIFAENLFEPAPDLSVLHIYFINKSSLTVLLNRYESIFKEILGEGFESNKFISQLERGSSLPSLVRNDEVLIGILLGFGEESSKDFYKHNSILPNAKTFSDTKTYCCIEPPTPEGCNFHPIVFMGNPYSTEVKELAAKYETELAEFWPLYNKSKKPLKTVLERLCETRDH